VISEDEATRLLKRADPARADDSAPFVDAAGYLAALRTRSTTVTLIDTQPNPARPKHRHHWPIIAAAAAVVAIVVGGLVLATRDDDPNEQIPAATTVAPDLDASAAEAEEVARGFVDAYIAGDADRALTYLADDLIATEEDWGSPDRFRRDIAWQAAARYEWNVHECQRYDGATEDFGPLDDVAASGQPIGTVVRCGLDFHALGSDALGLGPYDISWDLLVRDGRLVATNRGNWTPQFELDLWGGPFANWIRTEHPDDVLVMYVDSSQDHSHTTDESLRLWEQRTDEYVQAVLTGRETYAADVAAICATQAAELAELVEPAEDALDQLAASRTAAAAIIDDAHGQLIALDKPPQTNAAYAAFYGRLARLVRIAEESAAAASAGDSGRLAELDAEYVEVRQAASRVPAGSGLEECAANLPG
jgi:hypothetical protein